jgi:hypothetical protein
VQRLLAWLNEMDGHSFCSRFMCICMLETDFIPETDTTGVEKYILLDTVSWFVWTAFFSHWPVSLKALFNAANVLNLELQYYGFTCQEGVSFWTVWTLKILMSMVFFVTPLCCFYLCAVLEGEREQVTSNSSEKSWDNIVFIDIVFDNPLQQSIRSFQLCVSNQWIVCFDKGPFHPVLLFPLGSLMVVDALVIFLNIVLSQTQSLA